MLRAALFLAAFPNLSPALQLAGDEPHEELRLARELEELRARLEALESGSLVSDVQTGGVDLSGGELSSLYGVSDDVYKDVYALPWHERVTLSGYAAAGYFDSGGVGVKSDGGFFPRQATLFVDARAWERMSVFAELWLTRFTYYYDQEGVATGEVYARFHDLFADERGEGIDLKIGRIDVPFGEEYIWQDAPDNPLITNSSAWPYGLDEGILASGSLHDGRAGWAGALMDGTNTRSFDDGSAKTLAAKVWGDATDTLYLSASALQTGSTSNSGIKLSGFPLRPVGTEFPSSSGTSPSEQIDAFLWEVDAVYEPTEEFALALNYGRAAIDDDDSEFDREFDWFLVEPRYRFTERMYVVARYSEIGTREDDEGYVFDGKIVGKGRLLGYDTKLLQRLSVGLGWDLNPNARIKFEVGRDWYDLIDGTPFEDDNGEREFYGFEAVLSF